MRRLFTFIFGLVICIQLCSSAPVSAQSYATCDACGLCKNTIGDQGGGYVLKGEYIYPGNWESCRKCLYPATTNSGNPLAKETLVVNPNTGYAPTSAPGRYFSQIGCVSTDLGSFRQAGSAASVAQIFMNSILGVAGGIAFVYSIYAAFLIMTSKNNPERLAYGRRQLSAAIIGLVFAFGALFLVNFIATGVLKIPGFGT